VKLELNALGEGDTERNEPRKGAKAEEVKETFYA